MVSPDRVETVRLLTPAYRARGSRMSAKGTVELLRQHWKLASAITAVVVVGIVTTLIVRTGATDDVASSGGIRVETHSTPGVVTAGRSTDSAEATSLAEFATTYNLKTGPAVDLSLSTGEQPRSATLTHSFSASLHADEFGSFAYFDTDLKLWRSVPTKLSTDRKTIAATVDHFSTWAWLVGKVLDKRVDAPTCSGGTPAWLLGDPVFLDDENNAVRWCYGTDPKDPSVLVVKVRVNRGYGMAVTPAVTPQWTFNSFINADLAALTKQGLTDAPTLLTQAMFGPNPLGNSVLLPGGDEIDYGFTEAQARSLKTPVLVSVAKPSLALFVASVLIEQLVSHLSDAGLGYTGALLTISECGGGLVTEHDPVRAGATLLKCTLDHVDDVGKRLIEDGITAAKLGAALKTVGLAALIAQIGFQVTWYLADRALPDAARQFTVFLRPVPTQQIVLGAPWGPYQSGYGQVAPPDVSNGGDPTGIVSDITWQSWGGETATGTGTSSYQGTAPTVADSVPTPATIVAFNLGDCNGAPSYRAVEWYFPGQGEAFDPETYIDPCTGEYHSPPPATASLEGWGPFTLGMTAEQVEAAGGTSNGDQGHCAVYSYNGALIYLHDTENVVTFIETPPGTLTDLGVGDGMAPDDIYEVYTDAGWTVLNVPTQTGSAEVVVPPGGDADAVQNGTSNQAIGFGLVDQRYVVGPPTIGGIPGFEYCSG